MSHCEGQEEAPSSRTGQTGDRPVTSGTQQEDTPNLPFPADLGNPDTAELVDAMDAEDRQ